MRFRPILLLLTLRLMAGLICSAQETQPAYRNPKLTVEERASYLLQRMTLEEKVDQLTFARRRAQASNPEEQQIFDELRITVEFPLSPADLSLIDVSMNHIVEPGTFDIMVRPSSAETSSDALEVSK